MIVTSTTFANGGLHQTGERGKDVDRRVDALVVQLTVDEDLALSDVSCQIGNWMCNICTKLLVFVGTRTVA